MIKISIDAISVKYALKEQDNGPPSKTLVGGPSSRFYCFSTRKQIDSVVFVFEDVVT